VWQTPAEAERKQRAAREMQEALDTQIAEKKQRQVQALELLSPLCMPNVMYVMAFLAHVEISHKSVNLLLCEV
jgi:hypothetical protein